MISSRVSRFSRFTWRVGLSRNRPTLIALALGCLTSGWAEVKINEIMADNRSAVANGGTYPDYIELFNTSPDPVNLAGMSLTDDGLQPRKFVFPAGNILPGWGYLVVWCDTNNAAPGLHTGFALGANGERVRLYASDGVSQLDSLRFGLQVQNRPVGSVPDGANTRTLMRPTPGAANVAQAQAEPTQLRINEWMARPLSGMDDWIEVYNAADLPVALGGLILSDMTSNPTNRPIPSLSFIGARSFVQFMATDLDQNDADHLDFKLSSGGETLTIYAVNRTTVLERVSFGNQSDNVSQGRVPDGGNSRVFFTAGQATPKAANLPQTPSVVISEVLSHTDPPLEDAIELHNPTAAPVDISYWWLSDAPAVPKKYQIPSGTVIPAGGYMVFYEYQFGAGTSGFTFDSSEGDEVVLSAGNAAGVLTGPQSVTEFGALKNGVSTGRHQTSRGIDFVPMSCRSFGVDNPSTLLQFRTGTGLANPGARVGAVVISEIMCQPPTIAGEDSSDDEFIELHNPGSSSRALCDPVYPTNTWRLRKGITFDFPRNLTLPAGGCLLVVAFDPVAYPDKLAAFRARYSIDSAVPIIGPHGGRLGDGTDEIELLWPDEPQGPTSPNFGYVPYELVERITYRSVAPWPSGADGQGMSLQRRDALSYGNDPTNWVALMPSPGRPAPPDSDRDGMTDEWETLYGLNPHSSADAPTDLDGDRTSNLAEFVAGTRPDLSQNVLRVRSLDRAGTRHRLTFRAMAGRTYSVQYRKDVHSGDWRTLIHVSGYATNANRTVEVPADLARDVFLRVVTPSVP